MLVQDEGKAQPNPKQVTGDSMNVKRLSATQKISLQLAYMICGRELHAVSIDKAPLKHRCY